MTTSASTTSWAASASNFSASWVSDQRELLSRGWSARLPPQRGLDETGHPATWASLRHDTLDWVRSADGGRMTSRRGIVGHAWNAEAGLICVQHDH